MKLSNTMIMNDSVLPSNKKAFTLAEVLITLSILGVVAALTIPSLVNRQSELAAIVKIKKAISQYEQVAEVYMAENEAQTFAATCAQLGDYFKKVDTVSGDCEFTTADGVVWKFKTDGSHVIVTDSKASPKYGAIMWTQDGVANTGTAPASGTFDTPTAAPGQYFIATDFLKISKPGDVPTGNNKKATVAAALGE